MCHCKHYRNILTYLISVLIRIHLGLGQYEIDAQYSISDPIVLEDPNSDISAHTRCITHLTTDSIGPTQ
jgi:hypothetical protein